MKNSNSGLFAAIIIVVEVTIAILFYKFVLGNPDNFVGGDPANHPLQGNYFGIVYKGGFIVPILIAMLMIVITFSIERLITIGRAKGRGNVKTFVQKIKHLIASNNITQAIAECDKQKGSVANVVKAGLVKYNDLAKNSSIEPDKKVVLIQKDIEETTQLEMPMLDPAGERLQRLQLGQLCCVFSSGGHPQRLRWDVLEQLRQPAAEPEPAARHRRQERPGLPGRS